MSTKVRNKSAQQNFEQTNGTHQSSLLKIESVVPKLSSRTLKLNKLTKSHSTLTSAYIKKVTESKRNFVVANQHQETGTGATDSSILVNDGVYTIRRPPKDREKLPDRINLDRKGLTMIPAIEDEPNLRLLSLQHNLINVFHVPLETNGIEEVNSQFHEPTKTPPTKDTIKDAAIYAPQTRFTRQLSRQRSITARNQLYMNNNQLGFGSKTPGRNTPTQQQPPPPPTATTTFLQKSLLLNAQPKHILRKSNSFIQNYPNLFTCSNNNNNSSNNKNHFTSSSIAARNNKLIRTPSFSVESLNNNNNNNNNVHNAANTIATTIEEPTEIKNGLIESPRVEVKHNLGNLVFLDLYDNQIETITNLDGLKSLTVLLLGKNRITDISGLISVKHTLRVLDLHGNKITTISQKISPLQELKSLNLAGNMLKQISDKDFTGLFGLKELNLKRNKLRKILGFEDLRNLERLWLCHNELQRVEDMCTIARAINLKEVTIENNPVSLAGDCASFLVSYLPNMVSLSQMQITEQVRRAAAAWRKNKEISDASYLHLTTDVCMNMRREEIISNARTNWELLRGQQSKGSHRTQIDKINLANNHNHESRRGMRQIGIKKTCKRPLKQPSRDNSVASEQGGEDYFRLPPILAPFLDQPKDLTNSNSSLGPNVDSGSSLYSSDNEERLEKKVAIKTEENEEKNAQEEEPIEEVTAVEAPPIVLTSPVTTPTALAKTIKEITIERPELAPIPIQELALPLSEPVEDINQVDKQSNISSASVRSSESVATNVSSSERAEKCKSAVPKRQNTTTSISRAQTARSTNNVANSGNSVQKSTQSKAERDREQGGDYLIEICGRYLNVYGYGALKFIDKQWNVQKASDVHTIKFSYINYNNITAVLSKIKTRFPNAENFVFRETNIYCLGQLNSLAETQGLITIAIDPEGNPITEKQWRSYAIYRLSHWGLKIIDGEEVTEDEIHTAETTYSGLSDLVLWSLPEGLLQPLLTRLRLEETCQASKMTAKEWLMQAEPSLKSVVGKEALQWKKSGQFGEEGTVRDKGKKHFMFMMENTCNAVEKLQRLETLWSTVLLEMIRNTLIDYSQIDSYVKCLMQDLSK